jgi:hypothetical protein
MRAVKRKRRAPCWQGNAPAKMSVVVLGQGQDKPLPRMGQGLSHLLHLSPRLTVNAIQRAPQGQREGISAHPDYEFAQSQPPCGLTYILARQDGMNQAAFKHRVSRVRETYR